MSDNHYKDLSERYYEQLKAWYEGGMKDEQIRTLRLRIERMEKETGK